MLNKFRILEDDQQIQLKRMLTQGAVPTLDTIVLFCLADISQAKNGEIQIAVYFTRLRCTHNPCLSTWPHLRFSYRMKILPIVVSTVFW